MSNMIIGLFLLVVILLALRGSLKHLRGEGSCCGGGSSKPEKKRLENKPIRLYRLHVEGMHCRNCANTVTRAVNSIDGASAKVNLKKKEVKVSCDRAVDTEIIRTAVEKRGYTVTRIEE